jgi:hypothetical protein
LERWLEVQFDSVNKGMNATRYATDSKYAKEGKEWFAENYSLWVNGRKGLVDPKLRGLMERLDDLESGKITEQKLLKELFEDGKPSGRPKFKPPAAKGKYDISETLSYSADELAVIQALEQAGGMASPEAIFLTMPEGTLANQYEVSSALRSLRTKGITKHTNSTGRWSFSMVEDATLTGRPVRVKKTWDYARLTKELTEAEMYALNGLGAFGEPVMFATLDAEMGAVLDSTLNTMKSLEKKGLVRKWWGSTGTGRKRMLFEVMESVDARDVERLETEIIGLDI